MTHLAAHPSSHSRKGMSSGRGVFARRCLFLRDPLRFSAPPRSSPRGAPHWESASIGRQAICPAPDVTAIPATRKQVPRDLAVWARFLSFIVLGRCPRTIRQPQQGSSTWPRYLQIWSSSDRGCWPGSPDQSLHSDRFRHQVPSAASFVQLPRLRAREAFCFFSGSLLRSRLIVNDLRETNRNGPGVSHKIRANEDVCVRQGCGFRCSRPKILRRFHQLSP